MTGKICVTISVLIALAACQQTGTSGPMSRDANGMTPVGSSNGP